MWCQRSPTSRLWRRVLPDTIDTLLLISGVWLAAKLQLYPFVDGWLTLKLTAVLVYIGLGFGAFGNMLSPMWRKVCWLLALALFVGIAWMGWAHATGHFG